MFARVPVRGVEIEAVFADARGEATVVRSDRLSPDGFGEGGCRLLVPIARGFHDRSPEDRE